MLPLFKKLFSPKAPPPVKDDLKEQKNQLIFNIDKKGALSIDLNIANLTSLDSTALALIFYELNKGNYESEIMDLLIEIAKTDDANLKKFVEQVFVSWGVQLSENLEELEDVTKKISNKPCISPMIFSKLLNKS